MFLYIEANPDYTAKSGADWQNCHCKTSGQTGISFLAVTALERSSVSLAKGKYYIKRVDVCCRIGISRGTFAPVHGLGSSTQWPMIIVDQGDTSGSDGISWANKVNYSDKSCVHERLIQFPFHSTASLQEWSTMKAFNVFGTSLRAHTSSKMCEVRRHESAGVPPLEDNIGSAHRSV